MNTISDASTAGTDLQATLNQKNTSNQPGDALCTLADPDSFTGIRGQYLRSCLETCPNLTKATNNFIEVHRVNISAWMVHISYNFGQRRRGLRQRN